jgi:hypothetical protein
MSSQTLAQSDRAVGPPSEAEYNAVYAAVTATERGRWFLKEFANRNRSADTDLIMAAIGRIEAAIAGGFAPQAAQVRDLALAAAGIEPVRAAVGERDDPAAAASAQAPSATGSASQLQTQSDEDYSEAVAAIAASLTVRLEESAKELAPGLAAEGANQQSLQDAPGEALRIPEAPSIPAAPQPQMPAVQGRVVQDNASRWRIEAPDFVFGMGDSDDKSAGAVPSLQLDAQLLGAELMAEQVDTLPRAAVELPPIAPAAESVPVVNSAPAAIGTPAAETSSPLAPPMLDIVPPSEISRPQLRIAREAIPVNQRPPRYGSLTVSDALSEDEVIALFG